jgi:hypothetical protein
VAVCFEGAARVMEMEGSGNSVRLGSGSALRSAVWGDESTVSLLHGAATDWGVLDAGDDAPTATF